MGFLDVPGASLHFDVYGSGPMLLLIPGANGDGKVFSPFAKQLSQHFRVVTYDRRGFTRSLLDGPQDYSRRLQTDADDAMRLIDHLSEDPAFVFGTSSGAVVSLQLLIDHPKHVRTLIPYEPAAVRLLPDGQKWIDFFADVYRTYRASGPIPALDAFRKNTFAQIDYSVMSRAGNAQLSNQHFANACYWFERELRQYTAVEFDMAALAERADRLIPAYGQASTGYPTAEVAVQLARQFDLAPIELPDGHVGYATNAEAFAREIADHLLRTPADGWNETGACSLRR